VAKPDLRDRSGFAHAGAELAITSSSSRLNRVGRGVLSYECGLEAHTFYRAAPRITRPCGSCLHFVLGPPRIRPETQCIHESTRFPGRQFPTDSSQVYGSCLARHRCIRRCAEHTWYEFSTHERVQNSIHVVAVTGVASLHFNECGFCYRPLFGCSQMAQVRPGARLDVDFTPHAS